MQRSSLAKHSARNTSRPVGDAETVGRTSVLMIYAPNAMSIALCINLYFTPRSTEGEAVRKVHTASFPYVKLAD